MKFCIVMLVVAMLLRVTLTTSFAESTTATVLGVGVKSCGFWTEERKRESPESLMLQLWVLGFVSGVNSGLFLFAGTRSDLLAQFAEGDGGAGQTRAVDTSPIYAWIDNYCRSHPLDKVYAGALGLLNELAGRAMQKSPQ